MKFDGIQPKINIGKQYQVEIVETNMDHLYVNTKEPETCLWNPSEIGQKELNLFLQCINSSICSNTNEEMALTVLNNDKKCFHKALLTLITGGLKLKKRLNNDWSEKEIQTFMMGIIKDGKHFSKISSSLEKKSTKDCIQFYYLCKKLNTYRDILRPKKIKEED